MVFFEVVVCGEVCIELHYIVQVFCYCIHSISGHVLHRGTEGYSCVMMLLPPRGRSKINLVLYKDRLDLLLCDGI